MRDLLVVDGPCRLAQLTRNEPTCSGCIAHTSERILKYVKDMPITTSPLADRTFQSSDLSRRPLSVFAAAEDHPVEVTRRDGEDLVLMSKSEAEARKELLNFAGQLIAAATKDRGSLAERMADSFPWMLALSPADRELCAKELLEASRASFATGQAHLAVAELTAWQETAIAIAAGLGRTPVEWLENDELVERP
jgi:PHD/YefM family antitoxin component YafN of YafNO toxin-antitoxin module